MLKSRFALLLMCLLVSTSGTACSRDWKVKVESNTSWSGAFGNRTVDGTGNRTIDIPDDPPECVVVQKDTEQGFLSIETFTEGNGIFAPEKRNSNVTTTAAFGLVSDCSSD